MPTYDVTAPNGKQFTIDGDHVPNESELNDIFAKISPPSRQNKFASPSGFESPFTADAAQPGKDALTANLKNLKPLVGPEMIPSGEQISQATGLPKIVTAPVSAVEKTAAGVAGFISSPAGVAQGLASMTPAAPVVYAKWAYDMLKGGVASLEDAKNAIGQRIAETLTKAIIKHDNGNPATVQQKDDLTQKLAEDAVNAAASLLGGKVAAKAAIKPVVDTINKTVAPVAPATAEALKQSLVSGSTKNQKEISQVVDYGKRTVTKREGDLFDYDNNDDLVFPIITTGEMTISEAKSKFGKDYEVGQNVVDTIAGKNTKPDFSDIEATTSKAAGNALPVPPKMEEQLKAAEISVSPGMRQTILDKKIKSPVALQRVFPNLNITLEEAQEVVNQVWNRNDNVNPKYLKGGESDASNQSGSKSVSQPEVRPSVGEGTPLRQQGKAPAPPSQGTPPIKGPENVKPDDLQPALLIDGKPVTGGANHQEIFNNLPDDIKLDKGLDAFADDSKHVFVDKSGKVYTRQQAADALGQKEPLHSEDLTNLKQSPGTGNPDGGTKNGPVAEVRTPAQSSDEKSPTSIKNSIVDEERSKRGFLPLRGAC